MVAVLSNRLVRAARFQLLQAQQRLSQSSIAYAQQRVLTNLHRLEQRLDDLGFRMESAIGEILHKHQRTIARLEAGVLRHDPRRQLGSARETLSAFQSRLRHALDRTLTARRAAYTNLNSRLHSLSPLAVLQRGYALVQTENGALIRSVAQLTPGQNVATRLADGLFSSQITATNPHPKQIRKKKDRPPPR